MLGCEDCEVISYYTGYVSNQSYEELEHTADVAIQVVGASLAELFTNAAYGMIHLTGAETVESPPFPTEISIVAYDIETLLVSWLEELLFGMEMRNVTYTNIELKLEDEIKLRACLNEVPATFTRSLIKAVTYNDLKISRTGEGFEVVIVFDV